MLNNVGKRIKEARRKREEQIRMPVIAAAGWELIWIFTDITSVRFVRT